MHQRHTSWRSRSEIWRTRRDLKAVAVVAAGVLLCWARPLDAQRVRGQVVLADSTTPAAGVIVVATGDNGAVVRRALTTERGAFDLPLPHAGRFDLRVLRIGFAPTPAPTVELQDGETQSLKIVASLERISLSRVTVRGQDECNTRRDAGLLVARVWEETRKALMSSQLVADKPLLAEWIEYDRALDPVTARVKEQRVRSMRSPTTHAFVSRPAERLAADGYIIEDAGSTEFFAPDADVLLSESFANQHCFHLEPPPPGHPGFIGLGFTPGRGARDLKDIEGTLWLDRESAELQWLEYHYTNVPLAAERAGAGGRVEFLRLSSGEWLVSKWNILMPIVFAAPKTREGGMSRVIMASPEASLKSVQVTGGQVVSVARGDSALYRGSGAAFSVQLLARDAGVTAAGATVSLMGTDYTAKVDAAGRARISPVLEGRYRARAQSALMDSLGAAAVERDVEVRELVERVDSVALPRAFELVRAGCRNEALSENESLLHGTVRDTSDRIVAHAAVTVTFQTGVSTAGGQLSYSERTVGALTNDSGQWHLCGVPQGRPMTVRVVTDDGADVKKVQLDEGQAFGATDLVISPSKSATNTGAGSASATAIATVEISVVTRNGLPVADAAVELVPGSGPSRTVRTQASGHALVPAVEPGIIRVRARSIGLKAGELVVRVAAGRNTVPIILDAAKSPSLDTVRIMGSKAVLARHTEFENRLARHEATAAFTEEEIQKVNPVETYQMLRRVPSISFIPSGKTGSLLATSNRAMKIEGMQAAPCFMSVMIDGMIMGGDIDGHFDLSHLPPPADIHGIEVFAGPASIPAKYNGAANDKMCGLIAIWTR